MRTIKAHFDGELIVLEEPAELPVDQPLTIHVDTRVAPEESITGVQLAKSGFAGLWQNNSTRARITATVFDNEYHWGDFKGEPIKFLREWYEVFVYVANW